MTSKHIGKKWVLKDFKKDTFCFTHDISGSAWTQQRAAQQPEERSAAHEAGPSPPRGQEDTRGEHHLYLHHLELLSPALYVPLSHWSVHEQGAVCVSAAPCCWMLLHLRPAAQDLLTPDRVYWHCEEQERSRSLWPTQSLNQVFPPAALSRCNTHKWCLTAFKYFASEELWNNQICFIVHVAALSLW